MYDIFTYSALEDKKSAESTGNTKKLFFSVRIALLLPIAFSFSASSDEERGFFVRGSFLWLRPEQQSERVAKTGQ